MKHASLRHLLRLPFPEALLSLTLVGCAANPPPVSTTASAPAPAPVVAPEPVSEATPPAPVKQDPPGPAASRDVQFPPITRWNGPGDLELNLVRSSALPLVELTLVIRSGSSDDPGKLPGLARLVGSMLELGTRARDAAEFAEAVEFLGADFSVRTGQETTRIHIRTLSENVDQALRLLAEAALRPSFKPVELGKLRRRELGRLKLRSREPRYLARKALQETLYGSHPYARVDTTETALKRMKPADLKRWHRRHFVPANAFLVAVGDIDEARLKEASASAFKRWRGEAPRKAEYPAPPALEGRRVLVVDRPESVQSVIYIGRLALTRSNPDYVPLLVANQVLGGSAASRLFMDLRERRSLTYGAYSILDEAVDVGLFRAIASVRNEVTAEALGAFFENFERIHEQRVQAPELAAAHRYLSDSFPLKIQTAAQVADMTADQRVYGLPDGYWDRFRSDIRKVNAEQAFEAARTFITPDHLLVVIVGKASEIAPGARFLGPVRVVDTTGKLITELEALEPTRGDSPRVNDTPLPSSTPDAAGDSAGPGSPSQDSNGQGAPGAKGGSGSTGETGSDQG